MVRCLFLLIHFLVVQDYKLAKSTSHILSVPLNVECFKVLSWCIFFFSYFNCLFDHVQCKITIWAVDNALNSSQDKPSDLSEQVVIWSKNYENAIPEISEMQSCIQLYTDIWAIFYIYKLIDIDLKPRILMASFLLEALNN